MNIIDAIAVLNRKVPKPSLGLPDELFYYISTVTPLVNVDLLIKDEKGRTLLAWRNDQYAGKGWHLPGGIVRFKEALETRIKKVAKTEIGADIDFDPVPVAVNQGIHHERDIRGHFISILYKCFLSQITKDKAENRLLFQNVLITDLDEIPLYDYSILDPNDYRLNSTISAYPYTDSDKRYITVMASRGCPHHCFYCSSHTIHGRKVRYYSIPRVKEDLKKIKDHYDAETIIFQDDHFMADKQRVYEMFDILKELHLTAFFPNSLAMYALDRKMLEAIKGLGARQLVLAIESGSDRVLKEVMHKPLSRSIIKRVAADCRELGIYTDANIIIGFPGETKQDIEDSRSFLKTINVNWFRIYIASPLAGSEMLDICLKKNYIKGEYNKCNFKKANIETEEFNAKYIQEMAYIMNLDLNFVENSDFRLGNYGVAVQGFENAIKAKPDHAIAYYRASECYKVLGDPKKAQEYLNSAQIISTKNPFWRRYIEMFKIPL